MSIVETVSKFFRKFKIEKAAIVAVIIVQSFKRMVTPELVLFVLELLPWTSTLLKVFGLLKKANEILPQVIKYIVLAKGLTTETNIDDKQAFFTLMEHVKGFDHDTQNEFYQFFALEVSKALLDDNKIDEEEVKEINDAAYQKFFKTK